MKSRGEWKRLRAEEGEGQRRVEGRGEWKGLRAEEGEGHMRAGAKEKGRQLTSLASEVNVVGL